MFAIFFLFSFNNPNKVDIIDYLVEKEKENKELLKLINSLKKEIKSAKMYEDDKNDTFSKLEKLKKDKEQIKNQTKIEIKKIKDENKHLKNYKNEEIEKL
jgi:uncharacterized protein Smg (DUF494 family)